MRLTRHERRTLCELASQLRGCAGDLELRLAPPRGWSSALVRALATVAPYGCGTVYAEWPPSRNG